MARTVRRAARPSPPHEPRRPESTGRTARPTGAWRSRSSAAGSRCRSTTRSRTASRSSSPSTTSATPGRRRSGRARSSTTRVGRAAPDCASRAGSRRTTRCGRTTAEGVRLRGLRPARSRPLGAHLLRRPAGVRQGAQGGPGAGLARRTSAPSASWPRSTPTGCYERSGEAVLAHMTTPNTARDLDVIRAALGEKKLNYLGVSYGTYLGGRLRHALPGPRAPHDRRQRRQPVARQHLVPGQPGPGRRLREALERLGGLGRQERRRLPPRRHPRQGAGRSG